MTKNEPVTEILPLVDRLSIFYNYRTNEISFPSQSLESFFGTLHHDDNPAFLKVFDENEFALKWHSAINGASGSKTFTLAAKENPSLQFSFDIIKPPPHLLADEALLVVTVLKLHNEASQREDNYAEFVDLASHDLDSPMRKLSLFSERLFTKLEGKADGEMKKYMDRMQACITDMRRIVENLTILSKLNSKNLTIQACNTSAIVKDIVEKTAEIGQDEELRESIAQLPTLDGDCSQYKTLFAQLFENSVKFSNEDKPLKVKISYARLTDEKKKQYQLPVDKTFHSITIADNGIGFNNESAEKIFIPFVRLNGKSAYPGNGIGLALCKKIVENHRGLIYAEGDERIGARFTLILPQSPH